MWRRDSPLSEANMGQSRRLDDMNSRLSWRSKSIPSFPTPQGREHATALEAVLTFLEGPAAEWTMGDFGEWFNVHLVGPGLLKRPQVIREPGAAPLRMDPRSEASGNLADLMTRARARVIAAIRGLIAPVSDDRCLHAAIYGGRVRRTVVNERPTWVPSPREIDFLSDIVLSLLAAAVLPDRDFYRAHLCVCDLCHRVAYKDMPDARSLCREHRSTTSGFTSKLR